SGSGTNEAQVSAQRLLNYVRFRTEPEKRVAELEQQMVNPDPGPDFKQHLWDYVLLLTQGEQAHDLSDWIKTFHTDATKPTEGIHGSAPDSAKHARERWNESHAAPWLIAALNLAEPNDASTRELLKAAAQVSHTSPGYVSV